MAKGSSPLPYTSSSSGGNKVKDANEEDRCRESEPFEDTFVLNSPFTEPDVGCLYLDTEILEDSEPVENVTTDLVCGCEQEVVLDSEDEELNNREWVAVKGVLENETSGTVKKPSMLFQKRQCKPPCEQVDSHASSFGKSSADHDMLDGDKGASVVADSFDDNNHLCRPAMINRIHSPDPRDATQAALGFVDHYLSSNDVDLFPGIHCRKITREKSPHVLSVRGPLNLAKKIKAWNQNYKKETFKWDDDDLNGNKTGMFDKRFEASSKFGSYRQIYMRRQKKGGHLQKQGNFNTSNRCEEKLGQGPTMATDNNDNSLKELDVQSSSIRENVDVNSSVTNIEDMYDIGLDTQIAAEAMDALAFVHFSGGQFSDAHQPENASDGILSNLTENEAHLKNSSYRKNPDLHSVSIESNKTNASSSGFYKVTSSSSCKHTDKQESKPVFEKMEIIMKSKSTVERQYENITCSPMCSKHVPLQEEQVSFQSAAKEPNNWNIESRLTRIKDQPSHHTNMKNDVKEKCTTRHKRKRNGFVADPVKLGVRTKRLKLPSDLISRKSRLNHQAWVSPPTRNFSMIDSLVFPKKPRGKRKGANVGRNLNAPTVSSIDEKESIVLSIRSLEDQDNAVKSCFPHTSSLCNVSCADNGGCLLIENSDKKSSAGDATKFENQHAMHPLLLAHVEISAKKRVAQSRSEIPATVVASKGISISNANDTYTEYCKKPRNKNLSKTLLLKEPIRLGIPDSTSDMMWKELRHRRDMTDIRVLFSQHLDDSIIKQQKRIMARLNISVASSSMEATHFVADKFTRTKNMLETMAYGKLVVTHLWLESCGQANCFIDEKNYILRDMKKEKEIGFSMPVSLARARKKPLLKEKRVYITPHTKPNKEVIASLVIAVHGQVVDENQVCVDKNGDSLDDLLILSCEDDYAICHRFLKTGTAVYSSEIVLNGIVIQKLELERHQLFMNQVTRNNQSMSNRFGKVYSRR